MIPLPSLGAATALLLVATLAGCAATGATPASAPHAAPGKLQFAILMYERGDAWYRLPPVQKDALLESYGLWVRDLRAKGVLKEGNPIGRGGVMIAPDTDGEPDAEPLDPNDTQLTGYFIIEVASAAEAERIAATCPALTHGEVVHLRPVGHTD
ncbi:MAG: hypothetical protein GC172_05360 [Phycisphaera sp.]|nr:hypothetical protein [Phycisphaera sp.]